MGNQWEAKDSRLDSVEQLVSKSLSTCRDRESYAQVRQINGRRAGIDGWEGRAPNALHRLFTELSIRPLQRYQMVTPLRRFSIFKRSFSRENAADQTAL